MQLRTARSNSPNLIHLFIRGQVLPALFLKRHLLFKTIGCFLLCWIHSLASFANHEGINDRIEVACPATDYNIVTNKQMITITSDFSPSGGAFAASLDGSTANAWWIPRYSDITNKSVIRFQFPSPTIVTGIECIGGNFLRSNATYKIRGSNDGTNWTDVTAVQTYSTSASAPAYGAPSNSYKFPVAGNTTAYLYYQIYGVSYQTWYDWIDEFYFETQPATVGLANINCNDATTLYAIADDYITFDLTPNSSASGTYTVSASGGHMVTPSTGNFGSTTSFRLEDGSAGSGNVTLTVTDNVLGCDMTATITDPGTCLCPADSDGDGICDTADEDDDNDGIPDVVENAICNIDYNVTANKQLIELSATASTSGNIQVLFDGNVGNNSFYYPDVPIVGKEIVRLKFPKPITLTGIEFEIGNSYMFNAGATTVMQASNDGTTWTDISSQYVKAANTNAPGIISSAPYAETFQWTNATPYVYYRLYGVAGNTNQNPWINELHFQIASGICDLDGDGVGNSLDLDSDNDGIPDNVEGQPTLTYVAPNNDTPAQYLANNGINSAYGTGLVPPNFDGDFCEDFIDIDTDNDGTEDKDESGLTLTGTVGTNGFDNGLESADTYADANGTIDDPANDLASASPGVVDAFYRKIPAPGGVDSPTSAVNGLKFTFYEGFISAIENGITGTIYSTGYINSFTNADDIVLNEDGSTYMLKLEAQIEITTAGFYTFQITALDDVGAIFIDGNLHTFGTTAGTPISLTAGMHTIEGRFGENSGGQIFNIGYSGPDNGNVMGNIPDNKLWITPSMSAWHKADNGITGAEGATPTLWEDKSANGNSMTPSGNPIYYDTDAAQLMNYNASIYFTDDYFQSGDHINGFAFDKQARTTFVINSGTGTALEMLTAYGNNSNNQIYHLYSNSGQKMHVGFWGADVAATVADYTDQTNTYLTSVTLTNPNIDGGNNVQGSVNAMNRIDARNTAFTTRLSGGNDYRIASGNGQNTAAGFFGNMAEVIQYPWALSAIEKQKVESYLAIKYGLSLPTNYIASDGSTIWTAGGGYDNDIAGIGKDISSSLNQKQSKSQSGDFFTVGLNSVATTNAANTNEFAADKSFTVWGNNGAALDFVNPLQNDHSYASRIWKVKETGTVGTVQVSVELSKLRGTAPMLVRSTDATIDASDEQIALTQSGNFLVATVDLADGDYFTFAQEPPPAPGGVSHELGVWLRADRDVFTDAETTNAVANNPVQQWNTQLGTDHTTQTTASQKPIFKDGSQVEAINFNPGVHFDGSNDELHFPSKLGVTGTNNFTILQQEN